MLNVRAEKITLSYLNSKWAHTMMCQGIRTSVPYSAKWGEGENLD